MTERELREQYPVIMACANNEYPTLMKQFEELKLKWAAEELISNEDE